MNSHKLYFVLSSTFGARSAFLFEKYSKPYIQYDVVSIADEKVATAQKILRCGQPCWTAGRIGV